MALSCLTNYIAFLSLFPLFLNVHMVVTWCYDITYYYIILQGKFFFAREILSSWKKITPLISSKCKNRYVGFLDANNIAFSLIFFFLLSFFESKKWLQLLFCLFQQYCSLENKLFFKKYFLSNYLIFLYLVTTLNELKKIFLNFHYLTYCEIELFLKKKKKFSENNL